MCNPAVGLAISAISGFMQYQSAKNEASAINATAANNAKIAEFNARERERQADDAVDRGAQEAYDIRQRARAATARGRAIMAGTGFLADTGTNLELQAQNVQMGEVNALTAMGNATREAEGYRADADSERFGAKVGTANARYQAAVTKQNGLLSGAGTFATGAANYGQSQGWFEKKAPKTTKKGGK